METTGIYKAENGKMVEKQIPMEEACQIYINDPSSMYPEFFFRKGQKMRGWQQAYAKCLVTSCLDVESVVDFGCASGFMLDGILEAGIKNIKGYEYSYDNAKPFMSEKVAPFIKEGNVMEEIDCGQYDLAMSVEVAEHVLPDKTDVFVQNLVNASKKYIFLTAALPGQKGTGHINCRPREFWIDKFEEQGFRYNAEEVEHIRSELKKLPVRIRNYMFENIMLFEKKQLRRNKLGDKMKRGFIRALWGTPDTKYDEGWSNPSGRYARMEDDIKIVMGHENTFPFTTYIFGQENYDIAKNLGVGNCILMDEDPFIYDLQKEFWKHKLDIFQYAMEEDGYDEMVYLDWDCIPIKPLFDDFWDTLGRKESLQCNLQFYRRRKCLWRDTDWRKTCNGGFVYIRDKTIPAEFQKVWEQFEPAHKFWDEVTISKYIDNLTDGWEGMENYWKLYEPEVCNLAIIKKNRSAFDAERLATKNICFEHYIQALSSRKRRFLNK